MADQVKVVITLTNPDAPEHEKSQILSCDINMLSVDEFAQLGRAMFKAAFKSKALYDRYGWEHESLEDSAEFLAAYNAKLDTLDEEDRVFVLTGGKK